MRMSSRLWAGVATAACIAEGDGERPVSVSVNEQLNQNATSGHLAAFECLRRIEEDAVCALLA
jgi:hypothetical protein